MPSTNQTSKLVHRYDCAAHDGDGCDGHCTITPNLLMSWYGDDIAFVAEQAPATTLDAFVSQLSMAGDRMEGVGIADAEDLDTAATYLNDAANASGAGEQGVLLKRAGDLLNGVTDMVDEYRDMV